MNVNNSSTYATNINSGTSTGAVNVGTSTAGGNAVTIGNAVGTTGITQKVGTGNYTLDGVGASTYTVGASTTTGAVTIGGTHRQEQSHLVHHPGHRSSMLARDQGQTM